jgi:deoxyadenosine/deoxycytidine kinase
MIISVEGNIGCGKSTALDALAKRGYKAFKEPIEKWTLLDKFYEDKQKYALAFQLEVLAGYAEVRDTPGEILVTERSPMASRDVFGKILSNEGFMDGVGDVYSQYFNILGWKPSAMVYIHTPVDVCMRRITSRGRSCEAGVVERNLAQIERAYGIVMDHSKIPFEAVDGTASPDEVVGMIEAAISRLSRSTSE